MPPSFNGANGANGFHMGQGGPGGGQVSSALINYLKAHRGNAKYLVATPSSQSAAPIIIATGLPVMSLGGFSGSDPILTTAQLASLAGAGQVRYFLLGGGGGPGGNNMLTTWIQQHSKVITVSGTQLYEYTG
jgi:4-amino-4-deoxy-L-arabinose transferase-like glycosyltransferase